LFLDVPVTDGAGELPAADGQPPVNAVIAGRVESRAGTGLAGLTVAVVHRGAGAGEELAAQARTDGDGDFRVVLAGFGTLLMMTVAFRVLDEHQDVLVDDVLDVALTAGEGRVQLMVLLGETEVPPGMLVTVADSASIAALDRLDLLAGELSVASSAIFVGLSLAQRQAVVDQLEQAFLDPTGVLREVAGTVPSLRAMQDPETLTSYLERASGHASPEVAAAAGELVGKVATFHSLTDVDWPISLDDLRRGDLAATVNRFADRFRVGIDLDIGAHLFDTHTSDRIRYRDYLRAIWTVAASNVLVADGVHLSEKEARQQLENRFHQDFRTVDDAPRSANEVVAGILTQILLAPVGAGFGFGVAPGTITPRGDRSARDYLDFLIGLSGESAAELEHRYRVDLGRSDAAQSSPVDENVTALQGFLRDTFQSDLEPFHVAPDTIGEPIVPSRLQGHAPFFLYYDEWLEQQRSFHGENYLDIRRLVAVVMGKEDRAELHNRTLKALGPDGTDYTANWQLVATVLALTDAMEQAHAHYHNGEFGLAKDSYDAAHAMALAAMTSPALGDPVVIPPEILKRRNLPVTGMPTLQALQASLRDENGYLNRFLVSDATWPTDMRVRLLVISLYVLPLCRADVALATGDYARAVFLYGQATRFVVGLARLSDQGGYKSIDKIFGFFVQYAHGDLPYTVILDSPDQRAGATFPYPNEAEADATHTGDPDAIENLASKVGTHYAHAVEIKLFKLRQANAMLEWADSLYRSDQQSSVQRARELYKGVLWLWGETPPIVPHWPGEFPITPQLFRQSDENPAIVSQKQRARLGLYKIDAGLNWFGETDDIVPVLRFRPLKEQADRMASAAKAAQVDFIQATEKVENALAEQMRLTTLVEKSTLQAAIGTEQIAIAQADLQVAKEQVAAVEAQVAAKKAEIAKADSLFSQFSDMASGLVKTFTSLPDDTKSAIGAGATSEATGQALVGEGMLGLGAGASVMTGIGVFAVAGYITMSGMADAASARMGELATLRDKALPAAQRTVESRQHAQTVAEIQKRIAEADLDLAQRLIAFEQDKLLNLQFWVNIAQVARRLMRRYLDNGARLAWLAERALAYEQDRALHLIRLDYHLERLQGVTGADLLAADLAELELTRVEGLKRTMPVKRTVSLARDFPLAYGQLKATGHCSFRTLDAEFRRAYPGTTSYRVRAVSVSVSQADFSAPLRGALVNQGVSVSHPAGSPDGHVLIRPAESLPISEFRLRDDLDVYGLPDETLLSFEGSAVESFWELEFPAAGNTASLNSLLDVEITFDLRAQFDPRQRSLDLASMPVTTRHWVLLSAAVFDPGAVGDLQGPAANVTVNLPVHRLALPAQERNRKLTNVAVFAVDPGRQTFRATLNAVDSGTSVPLVLVDGYAASTLSPDPGAPPLPPVALDVLAGETTDQAFRLTVDKASNLGVDFADMRDVVLALEYEADLS
jgi:hypothetical protein